MNNFTLFIFIFCLIILQFSVLGNFVGPAHVPNLILAAAVCLVVFGGLEKYLSWIILGGIMFDAGSGWLLGSGALILVLVAFGIDRLNEISDIKSRRLFFYPAFGILLAVSLFLFDWASFGISNLEKYFLKGKGIGSVNFHFDAAYFWKMIFTILGGYAIYYILKKFQTHDSRKIFPQKATR